MCNILCSQQSENSDVRWFTARRVLCLCTRTFDTTKHLELGMMTIIHDHDCDGNSNSNVNIVFTVMLY